MVYPPGRFAPRSVETLFVFCFDGIVRDGPGLVQVDRLAQGVFGHDQGRFPVGERLERVFVTTALITQVVVQRLEVLNIFVRIPHDGRRTLVDPYTIEGKVPVVGRPQDQSGQTVQLPGTGCQRNLGGIPYGPVATAEAGLGFAAGVAADHLFLLGKPPGDLRKGLCISFRCILEKIAADDLHLPAFAIADDLGKEIRGTDPRLLACCEEGFGGSRCGPDQTVVMEAQIRLFDITFSYLHQNIAPDRRPARGWMRRRESITDGQKAPVDLHGIPDPARLHKQEIGTPAQHHEFLATRSQPSHSEQECHKKHLFHLLSGIVVLRMWHPENLVYVIQSRLCRSVHYCFLFPDSWYSWPLAESLPEPPFVPVRVCRFDHRYYMPRQLSHPVPNSSAFSKAAAQQNLSSL